MHDTTKIMLTKKAVMPPLFYVTAYDNFTIRTILTHIKTTVTGEGSKKLRYTNQVLLYGLLWQIMSRRIEQNSSPAESWLITDLRVVYQPLKQTHNIDKLANK